MKPTALRLLFIMFKWYLHSVSLAVVAAMDSADAPLYLPYKALVSTVSNMVFNEAEAHRIIEILSEKAGIVQDTWHTVRSAALEAQSTPAFLAFVYLCFDANLDSRVSPSFRPLRRETLLQY